VQSTTEEEVKDQHAELKPAEESGVVDVRVEEDTKLDTGIQSSTSSSVELITDAELPTTVNEPLTGSLILTLRHKQSEHNELNLSKLNCLFVRCVQFMQCNWTGISVQLSPVYLCCFIHVHDAKCTLEKEHMCSSTLAVGDWAKFCILYLSVCATYPASFVRTTRVVH